MQEDIKTHRSSTTFKEKVVGNNPNNNKIVTSKYTKYTFIPLNIYHQLSKISTLFFFITLILICIPAISPFEPWTYLIAFLIVIGISMVKDGIEDYKRHKNDKKINEAECEIFIIENEEIKMKIKSIKDIDKGDWLYIKKEEEIIRFFFSFFSSSLLMPMLILFIFDF